MVATPKYHKQIGLDRWNETRNQFAAIALVLAISIGAGAGYFAGPNRGTVTTIVTNVTSVIPSTTTLTIRSTTTVTTTLLTFPTGIILAVSVNGTRIIEGNKVAITATLFNTVDQRIKVSAIYNWPFYGLQMVNQDWPPCYSYSPFEFTVLKGNFSTAEVRAMGPGGVRTFSCMEGGLYSSFAFEPNSEYVYATGEFSPSSNQNSTRGPVSASVTIATNGYWDNGTKPTYPTNYCGIGDCSFLGAQHPFVRGVYTIAVADEWGALDVVHINVLI